MPIPWVPIIIALGVGGVAMSMAGTKCTILDTPARMNAWMKANQGRTPSRFLIIGSWRGKSDLALDFDKAVCESGMVDEVIIIDFDKLAGQEIAIFKQQGIEMDFPDEQVVIAYRSNPAQVYVSGGDQPDELDALLENLADFFAGKLDGQPIELPGATYSQGVAVIEAIVK